VGGSVVTVCVSKEFLAGQSRNKKNVSFDEIHQAGIISSWKTDVCLYVDCYIYEKHQSCEISQWDAE
jgi:hypothetical protein